jgi:hypothetical protein
MDYPPKCPRCGEDMTPLVVSWFCRKNCDMLDKDARIVRKHGLVLGPGESSNCDLTDWRLWTLDEPPPFGWTWACTLNFSTSHEIHARKYWDDTAKATSWYAQYSAPTARCIIRGFGRMLRDLGNYEGIAYKVPQ